MNWQAGSQLEVEFVTISPAEADQSASAAFKRLVLAAGEVSPNTLDDLYANALALSFAKVAGNLVGVGAIKRPYIHYRDGVFKKARSTIPTSAFVYELGWFHVLPEFGGNRITSRMVERLMPWAEGASVYATSRIDNHPMHGALTRRGGFIPEGVHYSSALGSVPIQLFVRATRRDDGKKP